MYYKVYLQLEDLKSYLSDILSEDQRKYEVFCTWRDSQKGFIFYTNPDYNFSAEINQGVFEETTLENIKVYLKSIKCEPAGNLGYLGLSADPPQTK